MYLRNHATGPDAVAHSHSHVIGILAPPHEELVAHEVGTVIDHKAAALHPAGVAATEADDGFVIQIAWNLMNKQLSEHSCPCTPATAKGIILFYEDRNFQGRSYECKGETSDLHSFIARCNSARVKGGFWVLYERPNYMGYQYVVGPGEYPDYHHWIGFSDSLRSCRPIRHVIEHLKLKFFERPNFDGQAWEVTESTPSVQERFLCREIHSCKVHEGPCVFFEHPNYRGRQYLLEKGEYRRHTEWGAMHPTVGSIRQITKDC